ncbi:MAG: hypothetical protein ACI9IA_000219 [Enterobacterales bacterium]|jgi:hypothetical protein
MAFSISPTNSSLSKQVSINPQAILVVEGLDIIFSARPILEFSRFDSNISWDGTDAWDGKTRKENSRDLISLESGTTNSITQQIFPDKESSSSISTVNISLVDKDNEVSQLFSFDNMTEILGKKADFFIGFAQGVYPEDSIPVFRGIIVDYYTENGSVVVSVSHPDKLKDQSIFEQHVTKLSVAINNIETVLTVPKTEGLFISQDTITSYIQVESELMELVSIDSDTSLTVARGGIASIAASHDIDSEATSFYVFEDKPIPASLKIMLSNDGNTYFLSDDKPKAINVETVINTIPNTLIFEHHNIKDATGLVIGDFIELTGVNAGFYTIKEFGILENGSYITVNETLTDEPDFTDTFLYKSQYNLLADGLGMLSSQVDVQGHLDILNSFPSNFVEYKFYLRDTIEDAKKFLAKEIYYPQGLYQIPRRARSSVKLITPPFSSEILPTIDVRNITNMGKLKQRRSLHKFLYNIYRYDFEDALLEDRFTVKEVLINTTSLDRIKAGKKVLKIESKGMRDNALTRTALDQILQRMKDRYSFAPTYINGIKIKYGSGFNIEVGDILPFGGEESKTVDFKTGKRNQKTKLYEVINKKLNIKTGEINIDILETSFDLSVRNAVVGLGSKVGVNSTTLVIDIVKTNDTGEYNIESDKWVDFIGEEIRVRSDDYTFDETVTLKGIDAGNKNLLLLESTTPLSLAPIAGYSVGLPIYSNDANKGEDYKLRFGHLSLQANILSGSGVTIVYDNADNEVAVGSVINIHSDDYTRDSFGEELTVTDSTAGTLTLDIAPSFAVQLNDKIEFSKFPDGGLPYGII